MFNRMFDESKKLRDIRFQESYNVKYFKKNKMFVESSKSRGVFRTLAASMMELTIFTIKAMMYISMIYHRCLTGLYIALRKY